MGYRYNPNSSDLTIVTVVLQYSVFAREDDVQKNNGAGKLLKLGFW